MNLEELRRRMQKIADIAVATCAEEKRPHPPKLDALLAWLANPDGECPVDPLVDRL